MRRAVPGLPATRPRVRLILASLLLAGLARGQTPPSQGWPTWSPYPATGQPPAPTPAPAPAPASPAIARVADRVITQAQFDRLAEPYLARLRAQLGSAMTAEVLRQARQNVFDELARREVVAVEAAKQGIAVTEAETDALLEHDPLLQTNGRFDPAKLEQFKRAPQSNYPLILPQLRALAIQAKYEDLLRARMTPSRDSVRAEFARRETEAQFHYLLLGTRDMSLEPETAEREWRAYHQAHPDEFTKRSQMRLRYRRWALPAGTDSSVAAAESLAVVAARAVADSLRSRTLADTAQELADTGLFEPASGTVPALGRSGALAAAIAEADTVPERRVLGPVRIADALVVAAVVERRPKRVAEFHEVIADARRRAEADAHRKREEQLRRDWYAAHTDRFRGARAHVTRLMLRGASFADTAATPQELERWYREHGRSLFGLPDSSRAWLPPFTDSLASVVRSRRAEEARERWIAATSARMARELGTARDPRALARTLGAVAETLTFSRVSPPDSLFPAIVVDSLLLGAAGSRGAVQGPRAFGAYTVVWRVEQADTGFVPTFEAAKSRLEPGYQEDRRKLDDEEARAWFESHRGDYVSPERFVAQYALVPLPLSDTIRVSDAALRAAYEKDRARFQQPEQVRARHILLSTRDAGPERDTLARRRADSLLTALRSGADFVELAKRFSEEPGAAMSGGDLGWFGRGRMVPEFERAAFALKPGELSGVVKSTFGYHIIKLEDRRAAGVKPFAEASAELRATLAASRADTLARHEAESLRRALARGDTTRLAGGRNRLETSAPFAASEPVGALGVLAGLGDDLAKLAAGRWAPRVYRSGRGYVVLRLRDRLPPGPAEFPEVRARALEDSRSAKRRVLLDSRVASFRAALASGATLDSLSAPFGGLRDSGPVKRGFGFVPGLGQEPRVLERVFASTAGSLTDTLHVAQGVAWLRVDRVQPPSDSAFAAAEARISQELLKRRQDAWLTEKLRALKLEVLRAEFRSGAAGRM